MTSAATPLYYFVFLCWKMPMLFSGCKVGEILRFNQLPSIHFVWRYPSIDLPCCWDWCWKFIDLTQVTPAVVRKPQNIQPRIEKGSEQLYFVFQEDLMESRVQSFHIYIYVHWLDPFSMWFISSTWHGFWMPSISHAALLRLRPRL